MADFEWSIKNGDLNVVKKAISNVSIWVPYELSNDDMLSYLWMNNVIINY